MHYKTLGRTGLKASILGFGAMRLPKKPNEKRETDHEESIKIIRKGIEVEQQQPKRYSAKTDPGNWKFEKY